MFKIYVIESKSPTKYLTKGEYMIGCTEIVDRTKLKKHLEKTKNLSNVIITHMTRGIPITKKTTACKILKDVFHTDTSKPYDGKSRAQQKIIIHGVDKIAMKCINDEKQRVSKEKRTMEYYRAQSEKIKQASYDDPDPISSEEEESDDLDGFIVGDDVYD